MIAILSSEFLKYKRTFTRKLILFAPLFFILIALPQKLFMPANYLRPWQLLLDQVYNWWPLIFIPMGIALLAALVEIQEKKAGNYRNLRIHNISPSRLWLGKIMVLAIHTLLSTLVLVAAILVSGFITAGGSVPWIKIFAGGFTIWLTSLAIIPLQLAAAAWKGIFASMSLGFLGLIIGVLASQTSYWIFVPWSWPIRLMCPIIGVHPNGVALESGDPLLDPSVILVGIGVSLIALVVFSIVTAIWFIKKEAN